MNITIQFIKNSMPLFVYFISIFLSVSVYAQNATRPNIVWIMSEDNSKHYLNMYENGGVETPNIESLAENGLIFNHAFSNSAVCSASRSTLISGVYGTRLASQYHRKITKVNMPSGLKMWLNYLKDSGYFVTNDSKTDFNINTSDMWSGFEGWKNDFGWRDRGSNQPFFHSYTIHDTHESEIHFTNTIESVPFDTDTIFVEPRYPDTELFRYTGAYYRKKHIEMDNKVGAVIDELKADGLYDDTFIFYFGDHGGVLPGSKGYNHETGVHIPLVVHIPKNFEYMVDFTPDSRVDGFVSFIDFGVTVLNLAGVSIPSGFDGEPFLGQNVSAEDINAKDETFTYADRLDEKYDFVRSVRKGKYKYTRNYEPFNQLSLWNEYRYRQLAFQQWRKLYFKGELNDVQASFFEEKPVEALYDVEADPYETNNLADKPEFNSVLVQMRNVHSDYITTNNDLSFYPEFYLINNAFPNTAEFGVNNQVKLQRLKDIADLQLQDYSSAEASIIEALEASDPWERYWGLIVCSSFGSEALGMKSRISAIAESSGETNYNRMRALEFLALTKSTNDPELIAEAITNNMYNATSVTEALLYLNSMAMLKGRMDYKFEINSNNLSSSISQDNKVSDRLKYLYTVQ